MIETKAIPTARRNVDGEIKPSREGWQVANGLLNNLCGDSPEQISAESAEWVILELERRGMVHFERPEAE